MVVHAVEPLFQVDDKRGAPLQLSEYQWSGNPRGMHNEGSFKPFYPERCTALQLGWYKFVCGGEEYVPQCQWLLQNNITPIIRIYRATPGAMPVDDDIRRQWDQYLAAGCKWFEFYNEPNLSDPEWPAGIWVHHQNIDEVIRPLCENWLVFAEYMVSRGAYPAFPALSESANESDSAVLWMDALLGYMRDNLRDRFLHVLNNGTWIATHPYTLNHFYQEEPGRPTVQRPYQSQNGTETGWHFEYPYDPVTQSKDPGRNVFSPPYGDPNGVLAMGMAFQQRLSDWFGVGPLPVVGTEGGVYPIPVNGPEQPDPKYGAYDLRSHAEATVAMFNWIATDTPEWFLGSCAWKEDLYFNQNLPAIYRMREVQQIWRFGGPVVVGRGPGPVQGEPDIHAVILAPGVEPAWFFEAAQSYWNIFRPLVTTRWDFIPFIPSDRSLGVTIITPQNMVETFVQTIQTQYPNVLFDMMIVSGDRSAIRDTLNARVWSNRRFG
ncbi:MAG: hypothetical protein H6671_17280 [Anaerolineaceae bacterium]|nr:hypothetical protein [Anaerolineaceae bacterium]